MEIAASPTCGFRHFTLATKSVVSYAKVICTLGYRHLTTATATIVLEPYFLEATDKNLCPTMFSKKGEDLLAK